MWPAWKAEAKRRGKGEIYQLGEGEKKSPAEVLSRARSHLLKIWHPVGDKQQVLVTGAVTLTGRANSRSNKMLTRLLF